ncbi:hypothetical protein WS67_09365 [Burkholderia singularis]|uniref:Lipoprotein n=1 Tax=Burkholderia singularis TaxID=1503053 RepID=A0A118DPX1_9BURK|nr:MULTISPECIES: hypothetical protein [Burkholderia]AOK32521.1 hypothetical protein AQ611_16845 [Burkholderia sp. Bp7605]KVE28969.1 hypothetical protein WS67_09365 [Burkholderia singularis]
MKHFVSTASVAALLALALSACANESSSSTAPPVPMVGSDRDTHGCIGSAGYSWCEQTRQCERPWELAKQKGFAVSADNFAKYCKTGSIN